MNTSRTIARRCAAIFVLPATLAAATAVFAQTVSIEPNAASYVCRPAAADETASAKMLNSSTTLVCRPIAVAMHMSDGSMKVIGSVTTQAMPGPNFSEALTLRQINAAYNQWLLKALDIDPATQHTP